MAGSMVRIQREYKEVKEGKENNGITAELVNSQFTHWKGTIKGPVWHPNISSANGAICLTGDHRVLTRSGWMSITRVQVGDEVLSFNTDTFAQKWKPVRAVTSHAVDPRNAADSLYRMQGSGMDVIATRDHRMLIARIDQRTANGLREETPVDYETVGELLRLKYAAAAGSTVTSLAHNSSRHVVSTGINRQPAVKVVIPGLERVCDWWWQEDQQLGFLQFLGLWLSDGYLSTRHGVVCIGQQTVESEWLSELLDGVFPRCCNHNEQLKGSDDGIYTIRCPPLYDYLRMMAVGPIGYNPRNPAELRSYPHFTKNEELATLEQQSDYHKPDDSIHSASTWTEDAMLAAFTGSRSPPSTTRSLRSVSSMDEAGGEQDALEMEASPGAALDVVDAAQVQAMQAAGEIVWENDGEGIILDGHWFCRKRWLGEQNVANVFSQLSRQQAIALLDGACRAEGSSSVQYDDSGEPTGAWQCGHSSFPLIDHLQLMGQLAGAAVDVRLHTKAGETSAIDGRAVTLTVDHWQVSFTFTKSQSGLPMQTAPLAQPVDVSNDIDARGYYQHEDDGRVYCITVESDRKGTTANFLTQRLCSGLTQGGSFGVQAHSVFVGNCLDILKNEWSPALTLRTALLSLQALLSCPNPDDPQDAQVAGQYKKNLKDFERTAAYWTATYATPEVKPDVDAMVRRLSEMGFPPDKCLHALQQCKFDENQALDFLFSH